MKQRLYYIAALSPALAGFAQGAPPPAPAAEVRSTIVSGQAQLPATPTVTPDAAPRPGDVTLNFPGVDIQAVARSVLGDTLGVPYVLSPDLHTAVTVVTQRPIARSSVLPFLEGALRASDLVLVPQNGRYLIVPASNARGESTVVDETSTGFGTESFTLRYVSAEQLRRLLDPIMPGVIVSADPAANVLTAAGTTGQRRAIRDLIGQFDVNWLRNMSFALYVPQRTDSRLIVPELDKLINGPGAPTAGLVKLIGMDRLNGILAISSQPQYLEDVRRWVEILDREGESSQRRLFVYRVQNGRSSDLAKTIVNAFGGAGAGANGGNGSAGHGGTNTTGASNFPSGNPTDPNLGVDSSNVPQPVAGETTSLGGANTATQGGGGGGQTVSLGGNAQLTISSDDANNAIVAFATPRDYAIVEDALRKLDVPPLQVMIEAAITEVTLNNALEYGVQWLFHQNDGSIGYSEGSTVNPTQILPGLSGMIAKQSITATLNALSKITKVNVVSAPNLLVINNQTASLQVGDQVPVTSATALSTNTSDALINQIEYRDTGVILKITPRVNSGGLVLLDVAQEVSAVGQTTTSGIDSPTISTRKIATSVAVQDGETLALGGLITDRDEHGRRGIPLLSALPLIGSLFGSHSRSHLRTELVVLLKPRIVRTPDDGRAVTEELREKMQAIRQGMGSGKIP